jgi:hypothetical protein
MVNILLRSPLKILLIVMAVCLAFPLRATEADLFEGLFGKPLHVSRENIAGLKGKGTAGYRVTLLYSPAGKDWDTFCASLQPIAEKRLRMEGYDVLISRAIRLDPSLPSICNIVVRKDGKMLYFSSLALNAKDEGCFVTYELSSDK